jgi:6-phosphofructokinase
MGCDAGIRTGVGDAPGLNAVTRAAVKAAILNPSGRWSEFPMA